MSEDEGPAGYWRRRFRWILESRENQAGRTFASFAMSSMRWLGPGSLMVAYHKIESKEYVDLDEWMRGCAVSDRYLRLKILDDDGRIQEAYILHWREHDDVPFPDSLDYGSSEPALHGVVLSGVWFVGTSVERTTEETP